MRAILMLVLLSLGACGFHLREAIALPDAMQELRIEVADPFSPMGQELGRALQGIGAELHDDAASKVTVLRVLGDSLNTLPLSVGGSARVQEYQVVHRVEFEVLDKDGKVLLPRESIERRRDYRFDASQALGAAAEDELARRELRRETLAALLRRIEVMRE